VRELALRRIVKARENETQANSVRLSVKSPPLIEEVLSVKPINLSTIAEQTFEIKKKYPVTLKQCGALGPACNRSLGKIL